MVQVPLNRVVKLVAWSVFDDVEKGRPFGTCLTVMDSGTTVKLMKVADENYLQNTPEPLRKLAPQDQLFSLVPADGGGFRIVRYGTNQCIDAGDWFFNPDGSRTSVRKLLLKPIDQKAASQVFTTETSPNYPGVDACKLVCTLENSNRYELTPNDYAAKEWVLVTLGRGGTQSYDLFAIQPQGGAATIKVKVNNGLSWGVKFTVRWSGGSTPELGVRATESGTITLDGVIPPPGTSCWVAGQSSMGKLFESSDNFTVGPAANDPYVEYTLSRGSINIGFSCHYYG